MKHIIVIPLLNFIFLIQSAYGDTGEILGCGGFVRSQYKLEFDKIEIKLFTKQGSLKLKTECAPNGYYFIPLENKGEFVLKISPPSGWTFEPSEYAIKFDGKTDQCSRGVDVNFDFKGFAIMGKVISSGFAEGPSGVHLELSGPDGLQLKTDSGEGGSFAFDSIPPGPYVLKAVHPALSFEKDKFSFEITNKNIIINQELAVNGYEVSGKVLSDGKPVEDVTLVLTSEKTDVRTPKQCSSGIANISIDVKGKIVCSQKTDKIGAFSFVGISPGSYSVIPVYKGQNTVYSVTPNLLNFELGHSSLKLEPNFEVEGFTVQGLVKGPPGASIVVNGEVRATSGHDGTFTIQRMKPGTYEFEVNAEKFQFDKIKVTISATSPVLPDFVPTRFLTCGKINIFSSSSEPQLTFTVQTSSNTNSIEVIRQKIIDPNHFCVFLPQGVYFASIESIPEKYFIPEKLQLIVPSGDGFTFKEFTGSISGLVSCSLTSCDGIKIQVASKNNGYLIQEITLTKGDRKFKFDNLPSGVFTLKVIGEKFCWKEENIDNVQLKNSDVENIVFTQTGVPLVIESTHKTKVHVVGKNKASAQDLDLERNVAKRICLSDSASPSESYTITPTGCHEFEKAVYPFTVGKVISLVAKRHQYSWKILSSGKITDLKLTRNGQSFTMDQLQKSDVGISIAENPRDGGVVEYEVMFMDAAKVRVDWQVFSYGYIFEPNDFTIETSDDCQREMTRVIAKKSHVIKGKLSPAVEADIRIELIGDPDATTYVTSNTAGEYIAGPFIHSSGFRALPELPGYTFKPLPDNPYSFTVHQLAKIQVKVQTSVGTSSSPLSSVLLSLSGPNTYRQNKVTDSNGEIVFGDLQAGQYYLKALLKEFSFEPSAVNIDLKEQETNTVNLKANRESFSLYGQLTTLSGELLPNILVSAKGIGNCTEYAEDGTSDDQGNFRIWALKSYCTYEISLVKREDFTQMVERTVPDKLDIKIGSEDVFNVSFVVITPVKRMDVSLRCYTNNEKSLDHLKAVIYSAKDPDKALHVVPFNGISYIILPPLLKDGSEYIIGFEANLNKFQYQYRLPPQINFTTESAYAHFKIQFNIEPTPVDQEIGKNSYIAFAVVMLVVLIIVNYERLGSYLKEMYENYAASSGGGVSLSKKTKSKTK
ncbi:unnamed protein product [Orchesella dallaii]|uniref:Nodal modulator 1 n=1 Tax=Orchesella dallaii TaxID=48710 RepID=A0ABP1QXT4_9HEXA